MKIRFAKIGLVLFAVIFSAISVGAQTYRRDLEIGKGASLEIINNFGRIDVLAEKSEAENPAPVKSYLAANSAKPVAESEIKINNLNGRWLVEVAPADAKKRIDLALHVPERTYLKIATGEGEVRVSGDFAKVEVRTETGTIAADVPLENLSYSFLWTASRPRFLSDVELSEVKEKSAGKFVINGKVTRETPKSKFSSSKLPAPEETSESDEETNNEQPATEKNDQKTKTKDQKQKTKNRIPEGQNLLTFSTARGIVLLNVNPNEVPSDLRERPLTNAAKAIIRSGDSLLMEAIRRASPKYFGEYAATLPPLKFEPSLVEKTSTQTFVNSNVKKVLVRVTDLNNRAVADLKKEDFQVLERGAERDVLAVEPTTAPFNLVLLLDVSGSVENYVDFIRKAARAFVETADGSDKIAIIIFNEDVKKLSTFTTDKGKLSESLDTFDAGGGTAFYDSLAFVLADTLRPLRGERTAIVVLTDGDDNHSFLPFDALLGSLQESGALVYPLYVPSGLIVASNADLNAKIDPLRAKYMGLTTKAEGEGERLAQVSGGVYYPITQLNQIQKAYDDIVLQLRTAYSVTFRSDLVETSDKLTASPRLKVKVRRENAFVKLGSVVEVKTTQSKNVEKNKFINTNFQKKPNLEENMEITGEITGIEYKPILTVKLKEIQKQDFNINLAPPSFILSDGQKKIAVSKWVSPKRTRSYPYERVYNTLSQPKRLTIIPVLKDEGANGDRDFVQFDTFSLMSLLEVYVIPAYYNDASKSQKEGKITNQQFDNAYILSKINEIENYHSSALHWNLKQLQEISMLLEKAKKSYAQISQKTGVKMHLEAGIDDFAKKILGNMEEFMLISRLKAQGAQNREFVTLQPKESLLSDTKGRVTITNYLGGMYYFTCDETRIEGKTVTLMEAKHSKNAKIPSVSDIKDGLLKMLLYANLKNVKVGGFPFAYRTALRLTSAKLNGSITSDAKSEEITKFLTTNSLTANQKEFLSKLFAEARTNGFQIILEHAQNQ